MIPTSGRLLRSSLYAVMLCCTMLIGGCISFGSDSPQVRFSPLKRGLDYTFTFDEAFAAPTKDGGYEFVLASGFSQGEHHSGKIIYPSKTRAARYLMHIQVVWRPSSGTRSDFPAATNATVRYYAIQDQDGQRAYIAYSGSGFVSLDASTHSTRFAIRDAILRPYEAKGNVRDPLGTARATGKITAHNDQLRVQQLLRELEVATTSTASTRPAEAAR